MSDSESDFEEIKINEIKADFITKDKTKEIEDKKAKKKQQKKKISLLKKYQDQLQDDKAINNIKDLVEERKVIGSLNNNSLYKKTLFEKDNLLLEIEESKIFFNPIKPKVAKDLKDHLYGKRLNRRSFKLI